jgi:hypothetical protein
VSTSFPEWWWERGRCSAILSDVSPGRHVARCSWLPVFRSLAHTRSHHVPKRPVVLRPKRSSFQWIICVRSFRFQQLIIRRRFAGAWLISYRLCSAQQTERLGLVLFDRVRGWGRGCRFCGS